MSKGVIFMQGNNATMKSQAITHYIIKSWVQIFFIKKRNFLHNGFSTALMAKSLRSLIIKKTFFFIN